MRPPIHLPAPTASQVTAEQGGLGTKPLQPLLLQGWRVDQPEPDAELGAALRLARLVGDQRQLGRCTARQLTQFGGLIFLALAGDPPVERARERRQQQQRTPPLPARPDGA